MPMNFRLFSVTSKLVELSVYEMLLRWTTPWTHGKTFPSSLIGEDSLMCLVKNMMHFVFNIDRSLSVPKQRFGALANFALVVTIDFRPFLVVNNNMISSANIRAPKVPSYVASQLIPSKNWE